ncbi:PucR family transcriptional regulator [Paenibacillus shunpengii]|uniref:PucR family transcriptional regulator n=1 Tax=Paenibacillus shunpengii TaxID=2054424 RepID=A0ABW5SS03_9BACL|nr:PucR family transcriptional regulator [Paenibacillus sp. PDC88]SDX11908.1 purine catabolism regulatory protein [Paenibacillus sp. PDC88]
MALTLKKILKLPFFYGASVVAGENGLDSTIESVNVMVKLPHQESASPDIATWLCRGQLLFTTEHVILSNHRVLTAFIHQMSEAGCAGMIIKASHHISPLPKAMLSASSTLRMPIAVLPNEKGLGDMMSQVMSILLNEKQVELERTFEIHRKFSKLFLNGATMSDIAQTLTSVVHHPILITNSKRTMVGWSASARSWAVSEEFREELLQFIVNQSPTENSLSYYKTTSGERLGVYPIHSSGNLKGYIIVMHTDETLKTLLMPLEQAAQVIALESVKQAALMEGSNRLREEFFSELLDNGYTSVQEIMKRGEKYGLQSNGTYWVAVCQVDSSLDGRISFPFNSRGYEYLQEQIQAYLDAKHMNAITTVKGDHIVIILTSNDLSVSQQEGRLIQLLQSALSHLRKSNDHHLFSIGLSNHADQLDRLARAYQEAVLALKHANDSHSSTSVHAYRVQQVPDLIRMLPYHKLREFCGSILKSIAFPKSDENIELLQTLDVYLQQNCNVKETARVLFLHRNTVFYRLNKCESLLQLSFKDPVDLLKLQMAVMIHHILKSHEIQAEHTLS